MGIKDNDNNSKRVKFTSILRKALGTSKKIKDDNIMDQNDDFEKKLKIGIQEDGTEIMIIGITSIDEKINKDMLANKRSLNCLSSNGCVESDSMQALDDKMHGGEETDSMSTLEEEEEESSDEDECYKNNAINNDYDSVASDDVVEFAKKDYASELSLGFATFLKIVGAQMCSISNSIEDSILISNSSEEVTEYNGVALEWKPWVGGTDDSIETKATVSKITYYIDTKQGKKKLVHESDKIDQMAQ